MTREPPATLDEPDTDQEVIQKLRADNERLREDREKYFLDNLERKAEVERLQIRGQDCLRELLDSRNETEDLKADNEQLTRLLDAFHDGGTAAENITMLGKRIEERDTDNEWLREAHERIVEWSRAYPLTVFPKPDLKKARELLEAGGMTLDAISADAMRHVIEQVAKISRAALEPKPLHCPRCKANFSANDIHTCADLNREP